MTPPTRRELPFDPDPLTVDPEPVRRQPRPDGVPGAALVLAIVGIPLVLMILAAIAALATPRSGQTTVPDDVSRVLSAGQSGAPLGIGKRLTHLVPGVRRASGAPSPSPAVALEATSEGPKGPTTPMPATLS